MNRIKELREKNNLSQAELAAAVKASQSAISKYELNQRKIPSLVLVRLCELFDCSSQFLLGESNEIKNMPIENDEHLPDITQKLLSTIPNLDMDEQQLMWNLIQTLKAKRGEEK